MRPGCKHELPPTVINVYINGNQEITNSAAIFKNETKKAAGDWIRICREMVNSSNGCSLGNLIYLVAKAEKISNALEKYCLDLEERSQSIRLGIPSMAKQKFITTCISPKQEFVVNPHQKD